MLVFFTLIVPLLSLQHLDDFVEAMQPKHILKTTGVVDEAFKYVQNSFKKDTYGIKMVVDKKTYLMPEDVIHGKLDAVLTDLEELKGKSIQLSYILEYGDNYILSFENKGRIFVDSTHALRQYRWNSGSYVAAGLIWLIVGICLTSCAAGVIEIKPSEEE